MFCGRHSPPGASDFPGRAWCVRLVWVGLAVAVVFRSYRITVWGALGCKKLDGGYILNSWRVRTVRLWHR